MSVLDQEYEKALEGMDDRVEVRWYDRLTVWNSEHFYAKVMPAGKERKPGDLPRALSRDWVEVHRVLSEGDVARLNRHRNDDSLRYRPLETYHGFDSVEDARAAGEAALKDLDGERVGYDEEWPRILVIRKEQTWVPISSGDYYDMVARAVKF